MKTKRGTGQDSPRSRAGRELAEVLIREFGSEPGTYRLAQRVFLLGGLILSAVLMAGTWYEVQGLERSILFLV